MSKVATSKARIETYSTVKTNAERPASDEVFLSCAAMFLPCLGTLGTLKMGAYELDISRGIEKGECIHSEAYDMI
jgi:hypothetical protein